MEHSKILPIATPDITSYAHETYFLSVLHTDEDALRWVYSNYIQLYMWVWDLDEGIMVDYYTPNAEEHFVPCLGGYQRMTRKTVKRLSPCFTDFVRGGIDDGYYVWVFLDEYFIPGTVAYQNRTNPHAFLINGYDDKSRMFNVTGYFANQHYGAKLVSYDDVERGFNEFETEEFQYPNFVRLLKLNGYYKELYEFKVSWVMEQLKELLLSTPSSWRMKAFEGRTKYPNVWGMNVYDRLQQQIRLHIDEQAVLDHRPSYVIWEHKKMMNKRLSYMKGRGDFVFSDEVFEQYRQIEQSALVIRNLHLKYYMSFDNCFLEQLIDRLGRLKTDESLVIEKMLSEYEA